jgi:hypothetical protein
VDGKSLEIHVESGEKGEKVKRVAEIEHWLGGISEKRKNGIKANHKTRRGGKNKLQKTQYLGGVSRE